MRRRASANEIGSCLFENLQSLDAKIKNVTFYSDCCLGQNLNQYVCSLLMHAGSEHLTIYSVNEWVNVLKSPERHNPYTVQVMLTTDFKECLASKRVPNRTSAQCGTLNWLEMRHIRVKKDSPNKIFFKTDFDQKEFDYISQSKTATWAKLKLRKTKAGC